MTDSANLTNSEPIAGSSPDSSFDSNNFFGLKMPADFLSIAYAVVVATGGVIGYAKAGSVPSLVAGLGFGAVLGIGAYLTSVNPRNYHVLLFASVFLSGLMGYRFYRTKKFMPAGVVFSLAMFNVLRFLLRFATGRNYF